LEDDSLLIAYRILLEISRHPEVLCSGDEIVDLH